MSVYEYICGNCKKKFQKVIPITEYTSKPVPCPRCKSRKVERVWSGVNVHTSKKS